MTVLLFFSLRNGGGLVSCLDPTHGGERGGYGVASLNILGLAGSSEI